MARRRLAAVLVLAALAVSCLLFALRPNGVGDAPTEGREGVRPSPSAPVDVADDPQRRRRVARPAHDGVVDSGGGLAGNDRETDSPPRAARIRGRVRDEHGRPLVDTWLHLIDANGLTLGGAATQSDAHGRFAMDPGSRGPVTLYLTTEIAEAGEVRLYCEIEDGDAVDLDVRVPAMTRVSGKLVDTDGAPLPGMRLVSTPVASDVRGIRLQTMSTVTSRADADSAGLFTLPALAGSRVRVRLESPWLALRGAPVLRAGQTDLLLVAHEGLSISGTVLEENGDAVEDALVHAVGGDMDRSTASGPFGRFKLTGLDAGVSYEVRATKTRRPGSVKGVEADTSGVRVVLQPQ